jgi:sugar phosphate isomerase/epimerase
MLLSMWSSYLIELQPEKMVKTLVKHGWKYAELSDEHGWMLLDRGSPDKVGTEFRRFAENTGLSFPQGHFYITANIASTAKRKRAKLKDDLKIWCDLFAALNIKAGVLHPGSPSLEDCSKKEAYELCAEMLEMILEHSKDMPFTICLENLIVDFMSIDELLLLIGMTRGGDRLGICLDTGHLNMNGGDCAEFIRIAGSRLKALHITDSIRDTDHILPFSAGNIDWAEVIKALKDIGYDGAFNFEVPKENKCPTEIRLAKLDYALKLAKAMTKF